IGRLQFSIHHSKPIVGDPPRIDLIRFERTIGSVPDAIIIRFTVWCSQEVLEPPVLVRYASRLSEGGKKSRCPTVIRLGSISCPQKASKFNEINCPFAW